MHRVEEALGGCSLHQLNSRPPAVFFLYKSTCKEQDSFVAEGIEWPDAAQGCTKRRHETVSIQHPFSLRTFHSLQYSICILVWKGHCKLLEHWTVRCNSLHNTKGSKTHELCANVLHHAPARNHAHYNMQPREMANLQVPPIVANNQPAYLILSFKTQMPPKQQHKRCL